MDAVDNIFPAAVEVETSAVLKIGFFSVVLIPLTAGSLKFNSFLITPTYSENFTP